jgi:predicted methyltransferase
LKLNLHEAIALAIKIYGPMRVRDIARRICEDKLYLRKQDGKCPNTAQISTCISQYSKYFKREDGKVKLTKEGEDLVNNIFRDLSWRRF